MTLPHYLVTVWNPSHASDTMDERLGVLIDWAGRAQAGEAALNALLMPATRKVLSGKSQSEQSVLLDGQTLDLGIRIPPQSLGTLPVMLEKKPVVQKAVRIAFPHDHAWLLGSYPTACGESPTSGIRRRTPGPRPGMGWEKAGMRSWESGVRGWWCGWPE